MTVAIYFNDLTLVREDERNRALLPDFAKVWAGLSDASGIVQMRLDDEAYLTAMRCVNAMPRSAVASLLRKAMRRPYQFLIKTTAVNFKQGEYVANLLAQQFDCGYRKR